MYGQALCAFCSGCVYTRSILDFSLTLSALPGAGVIPYAHKYLKG